jgi:4-amino-4-deoxy-L-arabinose transferase-like glycosyltransferase
MLVLTAILAVALLARVAPLLVVQAVAPQRATRPDTASYEAPALSLLEHGTFSESPAPGARPMTFRTPGYPLFIAAAYALFGRHRLPLLLAQALLGVATVAMTWFLARRLWRVGGGGGDSAAMAATADASATPATPSAIAPAALAALLLALDPASILASQLVLSDALFAWCVMAHCLAVARLADADRRRAWLWALAAGATLGAATHVRPILYYWPVPLVAGVAWARRRRGDGWGRIGLVMLAVVVAWAPPVVGWQLRNARLTGDSEFSSIQSNNLLLYRGAGVVALRDRVPFETAQQRLLDAAPAAIRADRAAWAAYCRREGTRLMRAHPLLTLRMQLAALGRELFGPGQESLREYLGLTPADAQARRGLTLLSAGFLLAFDALLALALARELWARGSGPGAQSWRDRRFNPLNVLLLGLAIYLAVVAAGPEAYSRFRVPFMPILAAYASGALRRAPSARAKRASASQK